MEAQTVRFLEGPRRKPLPLGKGTITGASQLMLSILVLIAAEKTGERARKEKRRPPGVETFKGRSSSFEGRENLDSVKDKFAG